MTLFISKSHEPGGPAGSPPFEKVAKQRNRLIDAMKRKRMKHLVTKRVGVIFSLAAMTLVWSSAVSAGESKGEMASPHHMEPVTVTAETIQPRKDLDPESPTNPYRVAESARVGTEVFTEEEIKDLNPKDINDLLDKAEGVNVTYQGRKSPFSISQRGGGTFTYIIDGAVLPPSANRILFRIPLSAIEELQVVRGSTSLTLGPSVPIGASSSGSGVNTGYIIIRTKRPKKTEATLKALVEKGTGGHPTATNESLYVGTKGTVTPFLEGYVGGLLSKMDKPSKDSWFDGQSSEGGMAGAGFRAGQFSLNMMGYHDSGRFEMQRGEKSDGTLDTSKWYYDPLRTTVYTGDMTLEWTPTQTTLLNIFHTKYEQEEHNESFADATSATKEHEEKTEGFGLRHNARFGGTLLQAGLQSSNSTGFGPNTSQKYNRYDTTVNGWSGSVEQRLLNGCLVLDGGYREDTKHIDTSSNSEANNAVGNDTDMAPSKVFALGSHLVVMERVALDGRYYHGEQGTSGDFDMRPETGTLHSENQERIELSLSAEPFPFLTPVLTWFSVDIENAKSATSKIYELDGGTYYYYTESDELRRGLELAVNGAIGNNASYKMSWTRMLEIESTQDGVTRDAIGVSNPENLYSAFLKYKWNACTMNLSLKKVDKWTDTSSAMGLAQSGGLGDYTRLDANIQRDFTIRALQLNVSLYGRNLTDEHYSTRYVTGFYPDRGCVLGTEVTLKY